MTDYATNSTTLAAGVIYTLGVYDTLFVGPDAVLMSTGATAIQTDFGSTVTVFGTVYGAENGINLGDPADSGTRYGSIVIAEGGSVSGNLTEGYGIYMSNNYGSVVNKGTITGAIGIRTNATEGYEVSGGVIDNGGDIVVSEVGIYANSFTGWITNTGQILAGDGAVSFGSAISNVSGGIFAVDSEVKIVNSGGISSTSWLGVGIAVHGGNSNIVNSGEISTTTTYEDRAAILMFTTVDQTCNFTNLAGGRVTTFALAILGGDGVDTVVNRGELVGDVLLGGSSDVFDGRTGVILGLISGDDGDDWVRGGGSNNDIDGGRGDDTLAGNAGDDTIRGGRGRDILFGGEDNDMFVYANVLDSQPGGAKRDVIRDFVHVVDQIDLSLVDADETTGGNQDFTFIGSDPFSAPGQVRYDSATGILSMNTDADLTAEMQITLAGKPVITAVDLIL